MSAVTVRRRTIQKGLHQRSGSVHVECCSVDPLSVKPGSGKDVEATWMTGTEVVLLMLSPLHLADHIFDVVVLPVASVCVGVAMANVSGKVPRTRPSRRRRLSEHLEFSPMRLPILHKMSHAGRRGVGAKSGQHAPHMYTTMAQGTDSKPTLVKMP